MLDAAHAFDVPGVDALRVQAQVIDGKKGCTCGCGTIDLIPKSDDLPRSDSANAIPVEADVLDAKGNEVGGLLLLVRDGLLLSLEVYSYGEPLPLPTLEEVRWTKVGR